MTRAFAAIAILAAFAASTHAQTVTPSRPEIEAVVGEPATPPPDPATAELIASRTASVIRCPVCQGLSIADSPSQMALEMRGIVGEMANAGYSRDQILRYFATSYGEFVLLDPPKRGINWIVWIAPVAILLGGLAVLTILVRRNRDPEPASDTETEPLATDPWLERARAIGEGFREKPDA